MAEIIRAHGRVFGAVIVFLLVAYVLFTTAGEPGLTGPHDRPPS